jgi:hypothetical protein
MSCTNAPEQGVFEVAARCALDREARFTSRVRKPGDSAPALKAGSDPVAAGRSLRSGRSRTSLNGHLQSFQQSSEINRNLTFAIKRARTVNAVDLSQTED